MKTLITLISFVFGMTVFCQDDYFNLEQGASTGYSIPYNMELLVGENNYLNFRNTVVARQMQFVVTVEESRSVGFEFGYIDTLVSWKSALVRFGFSSGVNLFALEQCLDCEGVLLKQKEVSWVGSASLDFRSDKLRGRAVLSVSPNNNRWGVSQTGVYADIGTKIVGVLYAGLSHNTARYPIAFELGGYMPFKNDKYPYEMIVAGGYTPGFPGEADWFFGRMYLCRLF